MQDYDMRLGERLEILCGDRRGVSNVQMITSGGRLIISEPMYGLARLPVHKDDVMKLAYYRPFGMLSCVVTAERIFEEKGLALIELEIRSQISRYQRRDFVRFETMLPVSITPLAFIPDAASVADEIAMRTLTDIRLSGRIAQPDTLGGFTLDISGGGMRFMCKKNIPAGTLAEGIVFLNDCEAVSADIKTVRCEEDTEDGGAFLVGAKFIGIEDTLRKRIIQYIFSEQLKRRKQGHRN